MSFICCEDDFLQMPLDQHVEKKKEEKRLLSKVRLMGSCRNILVHRKFLTLCCELDSEASLSVHWLRNVKGFFPLKKTNIGHMGVKCRLFLNLYLFIFYFYVVLK